MSAIFMDGLLLVDKPIGMTSHDVVDDVREVAKTRRVGHAGTLDPFASGLLILGINKGTKRLTDLIGSDKTYEATIRFGLTSTTDDPEGTLTGEAHCVRPERAAMDSVLSRFRGSYMQTAPAFSAKRINGQKLYTLARQGKVEDIELPKKLVTIHELEIIEDAWPNVTLRVSCSSGTYIRALARDLGEALGCGAYLMQLRRTRIGTYDVRDALTLDELTTETLTHHLITV